MPLHYSSMVYATTELAVNICSVHETVLQDLRVHPFAPSCRPPICDKSRTAQLVSFHRTVGPVSLQATVPD